MAKIHKNGYMNRLERTLFAGLTTVTALGVSACSSESLTDNNNIKPETIQQIKIDSMKSVGTLTTLTSLLPSDRFDKKDTCVFKPSDTCYLNFVQGAEDGTRSVLIGVSDEGDYTRISVGGSIDTTYSLEPSGSHKSVNFNFTLPPNTVENGEVISPDYIKTLVTPETLSSVVANGLYTDEHGGTGLMFDEYAKLPPEDNTQTDYEILETNKRANEVTESIALGFNDN